MPWAGVELTGDLFFRGPYLRDQVVQIELVLLTALTAVARKVIVLPPGTENKPALMAGFGLIVVGIAAAYWLVLMARRVNAPSSPGSSTSLQDPV